MDHFPIAISSAGDVTIDTGTIVQGQPIGTNTTGQEAEGPHINMLETLAGRIAERLLALPGVARTRVRVTKPNIFPDSDGVSVEVTAASGDPIR